jgi:hypothetical protein
MSPLSRFPVGCLLLGLFLSGFSQEAAAQTVADTARVRYSEETVTDSSGYAFEAGLGRKLRKITRLQIEERRLWKIGLTNFNIGGQAGFYGLNLIHEQKLRTNWSVLAELSPSYLYFRNGFGGLPRGGVQVESQVAGRYYYNLNKRIRKGKSASNFSANYLSLGVGTGVGRLGYGTPYYYGGERGHAVRASMAVLYGLQRRLGRYGFFDLNAGLPLPLLPQAGPLFPKHTLRFLLDVRLGIALGR